MVAQFVRLKLALLANTLRRSVWQTIGIIIALLYGLSIAVMVVGGAIAGGTADPTTTGSVIVVGGAVVVLGWWFVPLVAYGVDATLDPRRFVLFGIPQRKLLTGLTAASLISAPAIATTLVAIGVAFAWWRTPLALLAALIGGILALLICVVGSRATTSALAPLIESRRYRELVTVAGVVLLMLLSPAIVWVSTSLETASENGSSDAVGDVLGQLAQLVGWTPLGAPWAVAVAVHESDWLGALARLGISLVTLGGLWWVWDKALARAMVTPPNGGTGGKAKGLGWFGRLPATPTGAVAARCLTYWLRDPRYSGSLAVIPLLPLLLWVMARDVPELLLIVGPFTAWIWGYSIVADLSMDYTAFALHVSSGVSGRADRWGRALPVLVPASVVSVALAIGSVALTDRWSLLPVIVGITVATLGISVGVAEVVSARLIYPTAKPGESPFKTPQGSAVATMVAQMVALLAVFVLSIPVLALGAVAVFAEVSVAGWATLVVGLVIGVAAVLLGVRWGARIYDQRGPEILQQLLSFA